MTGSGYIAASRDKMKSRFDSVAEQTGIFAGDGGFDITVGNHTQLDGAVIASTATADKNSLDTGTLGFSDIHNQADFKTQHSGINLSGGGEFGGDQFKGNMPGGMISAAGKNGHAEGTTQAAVADGTITIRDKKNQQQDVANQSRDTEHANDSISPIFDKEKEQNRLQAIGLISEIGGQAADIARTQGELNAIKNAKDRMSTAESTEFDAARAQWQKENPDKTATAEDISNQLYQNYYNEAFAATGMGTGGTMQRGIQAATALAGSGNLTGALAGASAPELARLVKETTENNPAVNAVAHAVLGGVIAALQGNSAASGAVGAATGELVARAIADIYYPGVKMSDLTELQKQTISSLASVSAGIAGGGGIAGDSTSAAATGASAGKNAVENNALGVAPPVPVPVPGVPVSPGDQVTKNANDKIASAVDDLFDAVDKATQCSFGRACSSDDSNQESKPNVAGNMTDNEKAEYGGAGSGSPTPPEDDHEKQESKPVDKLNQKQESAIKKIDNTIKNALKDHDITGTLKDMDGNPVPKESGGYWDHMQEMQNTLRGLRNHAETLKNVNNPEAQAAYGRATDAINKIESALKGHGI